MTVDVCLEPNGQVMTARIGEPLIKPIQRSGLPIGFSCRGQGVCTACVVLAKGSVSPVTEREGALLGEPSDIHEYARRIACLARINGPVTLTVDYW